MAQTAWQILVRAWLSRNRDTVAFFLGMVCRLDGELRPPTFLWNFLEESPGRANGHVQLSEQDWIAGRGEQVGNVHRVIHEWLQKGDLSEVKLAPREWRDVWNRFRQAEARYRARVQPALPKDPTALQITKRIRQQVPHWMYGNAWQQPKKGVAA